MKKIFKVLKTIFILFLIAILLYVLYSKYIRKDRITKVFGYGFLVVLTGSMEPEIDTGSLVIIKDSDSYDVGDIITYEENENYFVTHRIIEKDVNNLITKGDKNNEVDTKISEDQIIGKVVFHSLILGIFIRKYLLLVFIIFTVFIIIVNIFSKNKKREEEEDERIKSKNTK